ncbi:MAG: DUF924 domain-containing protein [Alphaproteobacteria bacterium]|nr:DUF924 domain-containing protein [Alphaproteobacteria bacterium]MCY4319346.1 DUF924 domain-containing protein [Alphaproteobacteria bacterium]
MIQDIIAFWLADSLDSPERASARREFWYRGGPTVDDEICTRFGSAVERACTGDPRLMGWQETPEGALALILLLDQFTRNIWRGTARAYAGDAAAFNIVGDAIHRSMDHALHPVARIWLYHPYHHSEALVEQDHGVDLLQALKQEADPTWQAYIDRIIQGWTRHRDIVARFGRFPHRNAVLGRQSTAEEQAHMAAGGESFGQGLPAS